jgi:Domain of unknown function (DUF4123)
MSELFLLDGTLVRGLVNCETLLQDLSASAVYADMGAEAALFGPILCKQKTVPNESTLNIGEHRRRWRYGNAVLKSDADAETVLAHLIGQRFIHTADGQQFFLRYADARSLLALWSVMSARQRSTLLGPIKTWVVFGTDNTSISLDSNGADAAATGNLVLSDTDLEKLTEAMWPWNLLLAAEEADASIAERQSDDEAFSMCIKATKLAGKAGSCSFAVETLLAVAMIRSRGEALYKPSFLEAAETSRTTRDVQPIQKWIKQEFDTDGGLQ